MALSLLLAKSYTSKCKYLIKFIRFLYAYNNVIIVIGYIELSTVKPYRQRDKKTHTQLRKGNDKIHTIMRKHTHSHTRFPDKKSLLKPICNSMHIIA